MNRDRVGPDQVTRAIKSLRVISVVIVAAAWLVASCGGSVASSDDTTAGSGGSAGPSPDASAAGAAGAAGAGGSSGAAGASGAGGSSGAAGAGGAAGCVGADLDSNPEHCGACFHDCMGGACKAGFCQPVEVGPAPPMAPEWGFRLKVDETRLFIFAISPQSLQITSLPKAGGAPSTVLPETPLMLGGFALLGDSIYLMDQVGSYRLLRLPKSGGAMSVLWDEQDFAPVSLTPDADRMWFVTESQGNPDFVRIMRLDPAKGTTNSVVELESDFMLTRLATDDDSLYVRAFPFAGGPGSGPILRVPKQGGPLQVLVQAKDEALYNMLPAGQDLYYVAASAKNPPTFRRVMRVAKAGGTPTVVLDADPASDIYPLVVENEHLWWMRSKGQPSVFDVGIYRMPISGGDSVPVVDEVVKSNVAGDATSFYWVRMSGEIVRLVR